MEKKNRLGRGLDALIGSVSEPAGGSTLAEVAIASIQANPYQPRKTFDPDELASLRDSIRTHGILQPLVVRQLGDHYQLIAGERRLKAAQEAGLLEVPVRVVDFNDQQVVEAALVENIQRTDLNPIEKAQGFKDYLDRFQMTHDQLATRLGLARSTITNLVALLELPQEIQNSVRVGQITLGHAKVLKGMTNPERQLATAKQIIARGLSVHATEAYLKELDAVPEPESAEPDENGRPKSTGEKTAHVQGIEDEIRQKLGTKVEIKVKGKERGTFLIAFESNDDFERILEVLRR
jgi:ParB family chromosome partitioning protein